MDGETTLEMLLPLLWKTGGEGDISHNRKEGHTIKLQKKIELRKCDNYHGITLLSTAGEIFIRIILEHIKYIVDDTLTDIQAGFRSNLSCTDKIGILRIIIEPSVEFK